MYGHDKPTEPACVNIHTGFIITFSDCPVLWVSKVHTNTNISTTETEIIAMDHCWRELFPITNITTTLGKSVCMPMDDTTIIVSVHDHNAGALVLVRNMKPQFTPRIKYYTTVQ